MFVGAHHVLRFLIPLRRFTLASVPGHWVTSTTTSIFPLSPSPPTHFYISRFTIYLCSGLLVLAYTIPILPCWLSPLLSKICLLEPSQAMECCLDVGNLETYWFEGVLSLLLFLLFYILLCWRLFRFRECSWAHCFARGSVLDFREAVRACAMRRSSVIKVHPLFLLFLCVFRAVSPFYLYFVVYSIYTRICTVVTHPFASRAHRDKRKSYSLSYPDHEKRSEEHTAELQSP